MQYDQPYYIANGREIFERGNGLFYPNPFDPDPNAPVIYFHLAIFLLGCAVTQLGLDPGLVFVGFGIVMAVVTSRLTLALVTHCLPEPPHIWPFFVAMWGGGLFAVFNVLQNSVQGNEIFFNLCRYDPADGWWFLNWGRNLVYPMESAHHALMVATWLAVVRNRWALACCAAGLLAASHPFTGFQVLCILLAWSVARRWTGASPALPRWVLPTLVSFLALFLSYNFLYLSRFQEHQKLLAVWRKPWTLRWDALLLAYLPVGVLAAIRLRRDDWRWTPISGFWWVAFLVSFALANHDLLVKPHQPLHFTRGYVWMPLFLLGLPALQGALKRLRERMPNTAIRAAALAGMLGILSADNFAFVVQASRSTKGFFLARNERAMLDEINRRGMNGVLLCPTVRVSYLSAVYTRARPYVGHCFNPPDWEARVAELESFFRRGQPGAWFSTIDMVLARRTNVPEELRTAAWKATLQKGGWILFERRR
jgi:hypothetical protein